MKTKAPIVTTIFHIAIAVLTLTLLLTGLAGPAAVSALGFTPTPTSPPPTETPTSPPPTTTPTVPPTTPTSIPPTPKPPQPQPDLTITKTASPSEVLPGGTVTIHIEVCNTGDAVAEDVIVSDALPPELELLSASASQGKVITEGNGVRAELGSIWPDHCAQVTITARVREDVAGGTRIRNVASVDDQYDDTIVTVTEPLLPETGNRAKRLSRLSMLGIAALGGGILLTGWALKKWLAGFFRI